VAIGVVWCFGVVGSAEVAHGSVLEMSWCGDGRKVFGYTNVRT
jgi:hypothetical protein